MGSVLAEVAITVACDRALIARSGWPPLGARGTWPVRPLPLCVHEPGGGGVRLSGPGGPGARRRGGARAEAGQVGRDGAQQRHPVDGPGHRLVVVDGLVSGTEDIVGGGGRLVRVVQSGFVRSYALLLIVGFAGLALYFLLSSS